MKRIECLSQRHVHKFDFDAITFSVRTLSIIGPLKGGFSLVSLSVSLQSSRSLLWFLLVRPGVRVAHLLSDWALIQVRSRLSSRFHHSRSCSVVSGGLLLAEIPVTFLTLVRPKKLVSIPVHEHLSVLPVFVFGSVNFYMTYYHAQIFVSVFMNNSLSPAVLLFRNLFLYIRKSV